MWPLTSAQTLSSRLSGGGQAPIPQTVGQAVSVAQLLPLGDTSNLMRSVTELTTLSCLGIECPKAEMRGSFKLFLGAEMLFWRHKCFARGRNASPDAFVLCKTHPFSLKRAGYFCKSICAFCKAPVRFWQPCCYLELLSASLEAFLLFEKLSCHHRTTATQDAVLPLGAHLCFSGGTDALWVAPVRFRTHLSSLESTSATIALLLFKTHLCFLRRISTFVVALLRFRQHFCFSGRTSAFLVALLLSRQHFCFC